MSELIIKKIPELFFFFFLAYLTGIHVVTSVSLGDVTKQIIGNNERLHQKCHFSFLSDCFPTFDTVVHCFLFSASAIVLLGENFHMKLKENGKKLH